MGSECEGNPPIGPGKGADGKRDANAYPLGLASGANQTFSQ